jgi:hypothetical protein
VFLFGGFHQRFENRARALIVVKRPLGMPLHRQDKVVWRCAFEALYDPVIWTSRHDFEPVAYEIRGLMMA